MTGRGIAFVTVTALMLLLGLGTGTREIYFIVFCLGVLLVYAGLSAFLAAISLRCRQSLDSPYAVRGESVGLHVEVTGFLLLPVAVRLRVKLPAADLPGREPIYHYTLLPGGKRPRLSMQMACPHRGVWPVQVAQVRLFDIFGLFAFPLLRRNALHEMEESLTVYPQLYEIAGETPAPAILAEESSSQVIVADHGDNSSGTRQYRDGDSLKRIHWKQSIRTRQLHTRQYDMTTEQYNLLVMDTGVVPGADAAGYADMAAECAAALALYYLEEGQPVEVRGEGPYAESETARSYDEFTALYTLLAEIPVDDDAQPLELYELLRSRLGSLRSVHVITSRPTPDLLEGLRELAQRRCLVTCLCPDIPYTRQLKGSCPEDVHMALIYGPGDIPAQLGEYL